MKNENLFLIGYRGTGKTSIGKEVAKKLNIDFIDNDEVIVQLASKKIPEIFATEGEEKFREYETLALTKVINERTSPCIISCGGGIITQERNFPLLKNNGLVCLLTADPKTIFNRIYNDKNRPALTDKNPFEEIVYMLEKRKELYEKAKDFEINTTKESIPLCAEKIIEVMTHLKNKKLILGNTK
jgi:shikimate kinase